MCRAKADRKKVCGGGLPRSRSSGPSFASRRMVAAAGRRTGSEQGPVGVSINNSVPGRRLILILCREYVQRCNCKKDIVGFGGGRLASVCGNIIIYIAKLKLLRRIIYRVSTPVAWRIFSKSILYDIITFHRPATHPKLNEGVYC